MTTVVMTKVVVTEVVVTEVVTMPFAVASPVSNLNVFTAVAFVLGAAVSVVAGFGLLRFSTTYARMHAAGKASPVAFLIIAIGSAVELGWVGAAKEAVAAAAIVFTFPVGVHLLFRAVHRSSSNQHLVRDDLARASLVEPSGGSQNGP